MLKEHSRSFKYRDHARRESDFHVQGTAWRFKKVAADFVCDNGVVEVSLLHSYCMSDGETSIYIRSSYSEAVSTQHGSLECIGFNRSDLGGTVPLLGYSSRCPALHLICHALCSDTLISRIYRVKYAYSSSMT